MISAYIFYQNEKNLHYFVAMVIILCYNKIKRLGGNDDLHFFNQKGIKAVF